MMHHILSSIVVKVAVPLGLALVLVSGASLGALRDWSSDYNQTAADNGTYARLWTASNAFPLASAEAVTVDADGNVYTTGYVDPISGTRKDLHVAKHDPQGNLIWEDTFNGGNADRGVAITIGPSGDVYVTGSTYASPTADADIVILRYAVDTVGPDAVPVFTATYDSGVNDFPIGVAIGDTEKIYVTGYSCSMCGDTDPDTVTDGDIVTLRYTSSGNQVWARTYDSGGNDVPVGLGVLPSSDIVVAGRSRTGYDHDYVTLRYDSVSGNPTWERRFDTGADDRAAALAVGPGGGIFVTGTSTSSTGDGDSAGDGDFTTVAYDADGNDLWPQAQTYNTPFDPTASLHDRAKAAAVDPTGTFVVVAGSVLRSSGDKDSVAAVKYRISDAARLDVMTYDSPGNDIPAGVVADDAGNVYIAATQGALGARDVVMLRFDAGGTQTDARVYDTGSDDTGHDIALGFDDEGLATPYIAVRSDQTDPAVPNEFSVVKYGTVRPDLEMAFVSGPAVAATDGVITIGNTVNNLKDPATGRLSDAEAFDVTLYLSPVQNPDPATDLIPFASGTGVRAIPVLASGGTDTADTVVTVPPVGTLTAGADYWIVGRADAADALTERDESNNLLVSASSVLVVDPPELVPTAVSGPAAAPAASDITVDYTIENRRATDAGGFNVAFVLTSDGTVGNADDITLTGTETVAGVAGNGSVSGSAVVGIPNTTPPADYSIGIIVDSQDAILEADETNNTLAGSTLTVQPIPDLVVTAVAGPLGGTVGSSIPVDTTIVSNDGDVTADFSTDIYLSTDAVIDGSDVLLGTRLISGGLTAGTPSTGTTTVTIPSGTGQGVYYLGAITDAGDQVTESDENNNSGAATRTISIGLPATDAGAQPDLVVTDVTGPTALSDGDTITVSTTVQNVLAAPVDTAFKVGIYLSLDPTITTADVAMGERTISAIGGNSVDTGDTLIDVVTEVEETLSWAQLRSTTWDGNTLTGTGSGGGISSTSVEGDAAAEMTVIETNTSRVFGLSEFNTNDIIGVMDYAWQLGSTGSFTLWHKGTFVRSGNYASGDRLRIERVGGLVRYIKNTNIVATRTVTYTGPVHYDFKMITSGATIADAKLKRIILQSGQSYYLGAIADYDDLVTEVDETNNTSLQTDASGDPSTVPVSIQSGAVATGGSGGGGALGMMELSFAALLLLLPGRRRRPHCAPVNPRRVARP